MRSSLQFRQANKAAAQVRRLVEGECICRAWAQTRVPRSRYSYLSRRRARHRHEAAARERIERGKLRAHGTNQYSGGSNNEKVATSKARDRGRSYTLARLDRDRHGCVYHFFYYQHPHCIGRIKLLTPQKIST